MLFFFKEKPIEIVAFVDSSYSFVKEFSPIVPAKEMYPEWLKKVPQSQFEWEKFRAVSTVRSCPGIIQNVTNGFIVPMWSELALEYTTNHYKYKFADQKSSLEHHPIEQAPGFYEDYWRFKLISPWSLDTPVNLQFMFPFYHHPKSFPMEMPPGVLPAKGIGKAQINIFLFSKKEEEEKRIMIKHGVPLLHFIPITERKVTIRCEVISVDEMKKRHAITGANTNFIHRGIRNIFRANKKSKS